MVQWTFESRKEKYIAETKFEKVAIELDAGEEGREVQKCIENKKVYIGDRRASIRSITVKDNDLVFNFGTKDRKDYKGVVKSISVKVEN